MTEAEKYFSFCASFDKAYNGEITIAELEKEVNKYNINFNDFCDANDFINSTTWEECINEYGDQIKRGERE